MDENKSEIRSIFNFYSLKGKIVVGLTLLLFFTLVSVLITAFQINTILKTSTAIDLSLSTTQRYVYSLRNGINQSNVILQNQLIDSTGDYGASRQRLWENEIRRSIDTLNVHKYDWTGNDIKLKYAQLVINLKKLRNVQEEVDDLIAQATSLSSIENADDIEKQDFLSINYPKKIFKNKVLELIDVINSEFDDLQSLLYSDFNRKKNRIDSLLNRFWLVEILLVLVLIGLIVSLGIYLLNQISDRITTIKKHIWSFSEGSIPEEVNVARDEFAPITSGIKMLSENMRKIKDYAIKVGKGEFDKDVHIFDDKGELGKSLSEMHEGLVTVAERDKQRNWTNEGIALFGNLLREYTDVQFLYDSLISNLVKYLGANQGGIFILNESNPDDPIFELKSVYAFDRKRFVEKTLHLGQGLVGQSWREKDLIHLQKISENYVQIVSGLGSANPKSVLICPMINNETIVLGALELASFKNFQNYEIDFVKRVSEMIVSAISSIKNNEKSKILLEESQKTAELLRMKEIEMRKNLEQLIETQRVMLLSQAELSGQTQAINTTMATVEYDMEGLVLNANNIFMDIMEYDFLEIRGRSYTSFLDENELKNMDYASLWNSIKEAKIQNQEIRKINKRGEEIWFNATYTPVKDNEGKAFKIIELALEITEQKILSLNYKGQLDAINRSNAVIEFDLQGIILDVNKNYLNLMGYELFELKGKHLSIISSIEETESLQYVEFWNKLSKGENIIGRFKRITKDGREVWIRGSYNPITNLHGDIYKIINLAFDITNVIEVEREAKQAQEALHKQKNELIEISQKIEREKQDLLEKVQKSEQLQTELEKNQVELQSHTTAAKDVLLIVEFDTEGYVLNANHNFLNLMKYTLSEIKGKHHAIFVEPEETRSIEYENLWLELQHGIPQSKIFKRIRKDGSELWLNIAYSPLKDSEGKTYKIIHFAMPSKEASTYMIEEKKPNFLQFE